MRGRPRKPGARKPSGDLRQRRDVGTPETIAHRVAIAGPGNETLAHYPLGVALARGIITQELHDAGLRYRRSYLLACDGVAVPRKSPLVQFLPSSARGVADAALVEATGHLRRCRDAMRILPARHRIIAALDDLCVFDRWPVWVSYPGWPMRPKDRYERDRIVAGLSAISKIS